MDWLRRLVRWRRWPSAGVWVAVLVAVGLAVLAACVYVLPQMLVPDRTAASLAAVSDAAKRLELEDARLKQRNDVRTTLLQGLAGAVVAVGLSLTWRQIRVNQEGQVTERFTRAVDQLGGEHLDVRLGALYALERIARDSAGDRGAIAEILTAYIRQRTPWPPTQPGQASVDSRLNKQQDLRTRAPDVQAALTILGRGTFPRPASAVGPATDRFDLRDVDLRKADLAHAHLEGAWLERTH